METTALHYVSNAQRANNAKIRKALGVEAYITARQTCASYNEIATRYNVADLVLDVPLPAWTDREGKPRGEGVRVNARNAADMRTIPARIWAGTSPVLYSRALRDAVEGAQALEQRIVALKTELASLKASFATEIETEVAAVLHFEEQAAIMAAERAAEKAAADEKKRVETAVKALIALGIPEPQAREMVASAPRPE